MKRPASPVMRAICIYLMVFGVIGFLLPSQSMAAQQQSDPSFMHGLGKMIDGLVLEWPKTVLEGTLAGPPVVGTLMAALGGLASASQKTVSGLMEMSAGFDPWGTKRKP